MLEALAVLLIVLWLFGLLTSYTLGGLIHLLLIIAVVAILLRLISGRRVYPGGWQSASECGDSG